MIVKTTGNQSNKINVPENSKRFIDELLILLHDNANDRYGSGTDHEINDSGMYDVNNVFVAAVSADLEAEKGTIVVQPFSM